MVDEQEIIAFSQGGLVPMPIAPGLVPLAAIGFRESAAAK